MKQLSAPHKLQPTGHVLMLCVVFGSYFIGLDICEELKVSLQIVESIKYIDES